MTAAPAGAPSGAADRWRGRASVKTPEFSKLPWAALLLCLIISDVAVAHGTRRTTAGSVRRVESGRVVIRDEHDTERTIVLTPETRYRDMDGRTVEDPVLRPGDRVVIHLTAEGGPPTAHEVFFAHPGETGPPGDRDAR